MDFQKPETTLDLDNIRAALTRLEDTIVFDFIERSQFGVNPSLYKPHVFGDLEDTFLNWLLLETEKTHSKLRRYEAPDENAFFPDKLERGILPPLEITDSLAAYQKDVNVNDKIKDYYVNRAVELLGSNPGDDPLNYGSCALADVTCLQAMSRRVHMGKYVAEAKFVEDPELFGKLIRTKNVEAIEAAITKPAVEQQVLERVRAKAESYGIDPTLRWSEKAIGKVNPDAAVEIFRECIIPLTKVVEVDYLLQRLST